MSPDRDKRVKEIFADALEKADVAERAAYLDQACGNDAQLRQHVDALLRAHEKAEAFLEQPPVATPGVPVSDGETEPAKAGTPNAPGPTVVVSAPLTEKPGDKIGHYKLLQQIGEGGCGVVYMAEQEQPIRRRVALKVIKLGMDTKQVIARFEAERQALALMDHPNIAKVLDAGATDNGRPYFVMELVRGIKITDYCDQNNLPTEERLDLFVQICHAIQHAHQKGIIHRDIKPSNILVTVHDGKPLPKIIDFGIAKATSGQLLTDKTLFTAFEQFIGTPAYMSPEQAEMSTLDIDTRSDIYALGVLLYELLTGQTPFDAKELVSAGLNEMRRMIREQEPVRPSTRISTLAAADQTTVAKRRHSEPPLLIHLVRGDLDWIVMKCLEKDRTRRYETANGLAHDILCHLNNEPVLARPPSKLYRFQKLVRRNKLVFAASAAVLTALVIGLGLSTWLLWRKREARQRAVVAEKRAQAEASKSQQVARFLKDMLQGVGPSVALGRDATMLREILDKMAERVGKDLKDSPEVEAELRTTLGEVYQALWQFTKAEEMNRAALALRRGLWGSMNTNVADSLENLAEALNMQTKPAEAEPLVLEALTIRTNLLGSENLKVAECLTTLGDVRSEQGRYTEAEDLHRHSLAMRRRLLGNDSMDVADSLVRLSNLLILEEDKLLEAEAAAREAVAIMKRLLGEESPDPKLQTMLGLLSQVLFFEGKLDEAEITLRPVIAKLRKLVGSQSLLVAGPSMLLASVLGKEGKLDEAEQLGREALATYDRLKASSTPQGALESALCMDNLGQVLHKKGKLPEAEAMFRECLSTWPKLEGQFQIRMVNWVRDGLVTVLREEGKLDQAEAFCRDAVASERKLLASSDDIFRSQQLASLLLSFAEVLRAQGKLAEADTTLNEAIENARKSPASPEQAGVLGRSAHHLRDEGRLVEAEPLFREALKICLQVSTNNFGQRQWLATGLASILRKQGKLAEAEALYRETLEFGRKLSPSSDLAAFLAAYADMLRDQGKLAEAEPLYREGLDICRRLAPNDVERRQWLAAGVGLALKTHGKLAEAEPFYREAVTNSAKRWPDDFKRWEWQFNELVDVLQRQGKSNELERLRNEFRPLAVQDQSPTTATNQNIPASGAP